MIFKRNSEIQFLGWVGVGVILLAYTLLNFGVWNADTTLYLLCNIVGSVLIIIEAITKKDYQPVVLNIIWALVAVIALIAAI